jgi:high-affinity K+ transport system ATPase subunit B
MAQRCTGVGIKLMVGVPMNSGTQAAKEAGNMVDFDNGSNQTNRSSGIRASSFITRGYAELHFLIANDVAKYFRYSTCLVH